MRIMSTSGNRPLHSALGEENTSSFNTELASTSFDEGDDDLSEIDVLERLTPQELCELRKYFFGKEEDKAEQQKKCYNNVPGYKFFGLALSRDEFIRAIGAVTGSTSQSVTVGKLFGSLDTSNRGVVWWEEVLDYLIDKIGRRDQEKGGWELVEPAITVHSVPHCKRETIVKVVSLKTATTFCYAVVCKYGRVGVYNAGLELLESYVVPLGAGVRRRVTNTWLTDAVHVSDANAMLLSASDRSLHVYDTSSLVHAPLCHVSGMPNMPQCLAYCPATASGDRPSTLFVGDDRGCILTMAFHQPKISLFRKKHPDKLDKYFWVELDQQPDWVTVHVDEHVHADGVRQVCYFSDNDTVVSCSQDPTATLVIRHAQARRAPYIFRLSRGVRCFHLDRSLKLLATGSNDCVVRLWNPVVTKQPVVSLFGHKMAVVDVTILTEISVAFSCSADGVVKAWDIDDQCCLQTLSLQFPSFSVLGKTIEFGTRCLYSDGGSRLLVSCCSHLATLRLRVSSRPSTSASSPLPPPSREHRPAVPSPWQAAEARGIITPDSSVYNDDQTSGCYGDSSAPPSRTPSPISPPPPLLPRAAPASDLNARRVQHDRRTREMRNLVERCAPHLALQLHEPQELRFSRPLPLPSRMRERNLFLVDQQQLPERLARARLPRTSDGLSTPSGSSLLSVRTTHRNASLSPLHNGYTPR